MIRLDNIGMYTSLFLSEKNSEVIRYIIINKLMKNIILSNLYLFENEETLNIRLTKALVFLFISYKLLICGMK